MVTFDDSSFPVLISQWAGDISTKDVAEFMHWAREQLVKAQAAHAKVIIVSDTSGSNGMSPVVRKFMSEQFDSLTANELETWVAPYLVVKSVMVRGAIKAFSWINRSASTKLVSRREIFATRDEAVEAARKALGVTAAA